MARGVWSQLSGANAPLPLDEIARSLGIMDIKVQEFDGFEGMLLTDQRRSTGGILANNRYGRRRARFTIAHELGHFLMEWHVLSDVAGFRCRPEDMRETREDRRDRKQEVQANRFAIELLAPPACVDPILSPSPDLRDAQRLRDALDISLEASVRRMIELREEPLAVVVSRQGRVRYAIRENGFPWITSSLGDPLPRFSMAHRVVAGGSAGFTEPAETAAVAWTGRTELVLWEQTRVGANGNAITLLEAEPPEPDHEDDLPELGTPRFR